MRKTIVSLALLYLTAAPLQAQLAPDSLFDHLIGQWVLRGTIARQSTTHDVTFEWMLGREYVRMHEISREKAPTEPPLTRPSCSLAGIRKPASTDVSGSPTRERPPLIPQGWAAAASRVTRFPSFSVTVIPTVFTPPSSTIAPRMPGSGTWTMTAPESAAHLPG